MCFNAVGLFPRCVSRRCLSADTSLSRRCSRLGCYEVKVREATKPVCGVFQ